MEGEDIFGEEFEVDNIENIIEEEKIVDFKIDETGEIFEDTSSPIIEKLLESKGIVDSKVNILDENEETIEVNFNELPLEEQLEILTYQDDVKPVVETDLEGVNKQFFNGLKENNIDVNQYLTAYKEQIIRENQLVSEDNTYEVDTFTDQELFLADVIDKYSLTEDEARSELNRALEDEAMFTKKMTKTREEYKVGEDSHREDQKRAIELQKAEEHEKYTELMVNAAINNSELYGIEIEDAEKNEVLGTVLEIDEVVGLSAFDKDMKDPVKKYEAAWFMRYGKEAFEAIQNAYEGEIERLKKEIKPQSTKRKVVVPPKKVDDENSIFNLNF